MDRSRPIEGISGCRTKRGSRIATCSVVLIMGLSLSACGSGSGGAQLQAPSLTSGIRDAFTKAASGITANMPADLSGPDGTFHFVYDPTSFGCKAGPAQGLFKCAITVDWQSYPFPASESPGFVTYCQQNPAAPSCNNSNGMITRNDAYRQYGVILTGGFKKCLHASLTPEPNASGTTWNNGPSDESPSNSPPPAGVDPPTSFSFHLSSPTDAHATSSPCT